MQLLVRKSVNGRLLPRIDSPLRSPTAYNNGVPGGPWLSFTLTGSDMVEYTIRLNDADLAELTASRQHYSGPLYAWRVPEVATGPAISDTNPGD